VFEFIASGRPSRVMKRRWQCVSLLDKGYWTADTILGYREHFDILRTRGLASWSFT
jgi:hypothetical protein